MRMLRDVQGVHGGFAVSRSGARIDRDLPEIFDDELLSRVGPRMARLHEALAGSHAEMGACTLRYAEHKLYLRIVRWGLVGVVLAANVNLPALRMVRVANSWSIEIRRVGSTFRVS